MNKKLLTVAVAGALAAPGLALAEGSSVTISGFIKQGIESLNYSGVAANTRANTSQMRVVDGASRVVFNSTESLGNGMSGIMQIDMRVWPNTNAASGGPGIALDGGNTYVGLSSKTMGELTFGRRDLHYMVATMPVDNTASVAGALQAVPTSLMDYAQIGGTAATSFNMSAGVGSQLQTVKWQSPNWNGFGLVVGWSADTSGGAQDMALSATTARKGDAWNVAPSYQNGPFGVGYSYYKEKPDAPGAFSVDTNAQTLWGYYKFGDFKIGLAWNRIQMDAAVGGGSVGDRDAWTIPMSYTWGPHNIAGHYTQASDSDNAAGSMNDTGARMFALAYSYSLSKRTAVGLTYAKISNDRNAAYSLFTNQYGFGGTATVAPMNGESPRMIQATVVHNF